MFTCFMLYKTKPVNFINKRAGKHDTYGVFKGINVF